MSNIEQRLDVIAEDVSSKILSNYNTIVEGLRDEHNWVAGKLNDLQTELHTEVEDLQTELAQCGQQAETLRRQRMRLEERLAVAREEAADLKGAGNGDGL